MKKNTLKALVLGFILGSMFFGVISGAAVQTFLLENFQVRYIFNNVEKSGSDKPFFYKNGANYVPGALIYAGTTYVPLRFVCNSLGLPVKYFAPQKKIYVGEVPDGDFMSNLLKPYQINDMVLENSVIRIKDTVYDTGYRFHCVKEESSVLFPLAKRYTTITGSIGMAEDAKWGASVKVYRDDVLIYSTSMFQIDAAQTFKWNVSGGEVLRIVIDGVKTADTVVNFGDLVIR
jgi:hypothetical protein